MEPRVLLTSGGTGGHLFPAMAVAEELMDHHECQILFAGGALKKNPYFDSSRFQCKDVACEPFSLSPFKFIKAIYSLVKGVYDSIKIIREFQPDLVIGFGSYYTLPVLIASKMLRVPIFLHEANSIPGRVNKMFSPIAEKTWVHFEKTKELLRGPADYSGMPLRSRFKKGIISKEGARRKFQLSPHLMTFLVFGGSQGAKKINVFFSEAALFHLKGNMMSFQVIHLTGSHEEAEQIMGRYVCAGIPAYVRPFEKKMEIAWAAADIVISRAGATSIAEQFEFEVPGILIPYPFSMDNHQEKNADFLVNTGLAMKMQEAGLTPASLAGKIQELTLTLEKRVADFREFRLKRTEEQISLSEQLMGWLDKKNQQEALKE